MAYVRMYCCNEHFSVKEPVEKSSGKVSSRATRPRQLAVAQSKLSLIKRREEKPGTDLQAILLS